MRRIDILDTPVRYGLVSRFLHWISAYLLLWQFATLVGWRFLGDGEVMRTVFRLGPYHGTVGVLILALVVPRAIWAITSRERRPPRKPGPGGWSARVVHAAMYVLMFVVPALALARAHGSGKGYALWGMQLVAQTGREVAWLVRPADLFHGPLAWVLSGLIAGHIAMALVHRIAERSRRPASSMPRQA